MDTHSTLRVPARLAPCILFTGWIMTGYLGIWQLPFSSSWVLLLLFPILAHLIRPGKKSSYFAGFMMMGFASSVLIGYLYQLTTPEAIPPTPAAFLGAGLLILTGMTMGYWFIHLAQQYSSSNQRVHDQRGDYRQQ